MLLLGTSLTGYGQSETDSAQILLITRQMDVLRTDNEILLNSLDLTNRTLNDLINDKKISDGTKWQTIKSNINHSTQLYKVLSDDIIDLKSRLTDEDYQGYIKSLSSIQEGPLGFSFQDIIIESANKIVLFPNKTQLDRFLDVSRNIMSSPIIASVPFVSNAVSASNSILNVAYSASLSDKKNDLTKLKTFENELNRYIAYYTTLDKANVLNQTSNSDRRVLLENLQMELLTKLKKDAPRLGYTVPERRTNESIDSYFNRVLGEFNREWSDKYLSELERKYRNSRGEVNYSDLIQKEMDIKYFNNNVTGLVDLSKKYILYYDNFFEIADNYQLRIIEAIDLARSNNIIKAKKTNSGELSPVQVYEEIITSLRNKKYARDNGIINSINIVELKQQMERVLDYKVI
ncbi:hypothetical protein EL17_19360 [Anditalea andensis]|uniref:Uncharacterized protein n=2 Tax=Anditalea andensis TaxID=1048983 RepID=A0A074LE64_9BACT|nr:hypothetical protein EL17_19360 [Anditalea andensis]